ncbi:hypothetical protein TNCV_2509281 [Trichonephila clavipes]|nr:hypothetical protein TNCV_2509281 [Trichonephila clavipes]
MDMGIMQGRNHRSTITYHAATNDNNTRWPGFPGGATVPYVIRQDLVKVLARMYPLCMIVGSTDQGKSQEHLFPRVAKGGIRSMAVEHQTASAEEV